MNSAPAELLQLLPFAALQPSAVPPRFITQLVAKSEFGCFVFDAVRFFRSSHRARHPTVSSNKKPPCLKKIGHGGRRKRCGFVHIRVNLYPCFASFFWRRAGQKTPHTTTRICNRPKVHENLVDAQPARYVFTGFFAGIGALTYKRAANDQFTCAHADMGTRRAWSSHAQTRSRAWRFQRQSPRAIARDLSITPRVFLQRYFAATEVLQRRITQRPAGFPDSRLPMPEQTQ